MTDEEYRQQEAELEDLYREIIIDHYRNPRHKGHLSAPTACHEGLNPLCGDEVTIEVHVDGGKLDDIAYSGSGCSISQSSASMMAEAVYGKTVAEARREIANFTGMMRGEEGIDPDALGDLEAMAGVRKFPTRIKCATLAWHTLAEALDEAEPSN
ncbi:MAG TPA: SUF system NifU family Fe-S cluster assembly protein [Dehalococcoidia bacterium]|nr:SUF system NifU family Fe-S cluster assembly protein [Dehalococcoidia bacterium]